MDEGLIPAFTSGDKVRTLLIGTSDEAVYMANQIRSNPHLDYKVIGLVRLDEKETRSWIQCFEAVISCETVHFGST